MNNIISTLIFSHPFIILLFLAFGKHIRNNWKSTHNPNWNETQIWKNTHEHTRKTKFILVPTRSLYYIHKHAYSNTRIHTIKIQITCIINNNLTTMNQPTKINRTSTADTLQSCCQNLYSIVIRLQKKQQFATYN